MYTCTKAISMLMHWLWQLYNQKPPVIASRVEESNMLAKW
jgi:hypothetical protein